MLGLHERQHGLRALAASVQEELAPYLRAKADISAAEIGAFFKRHVDASAAAAFTLQSLQEHEEQYQRVATQFPYLVHRVAKLSCPMLEQRYDAERTLSFPAAGPRKANESLLFHTTRADPVTICAEGLDLRMSMGAAALHKGRGGLLGMGIYFGNDPAKSDAYGLPSRDGEKFMFVFEVQLGDCKEYDAPQRDLLREPPKEAHERAADDPRPEYDSVTAVFSRGREFAIYNSHRCVPRYVVAYSDVHGGRR